MPHAKRWCREGRDLTANSPRQLHRVGGLHRLRQAAFRPGLKVRGHGRDKHNIEFRCRACKMDPLHWRSSVANTGFSVKPRPPSFSKPRAARHCARADLCSVFEDAPFGIEAPRSGGMRAGAVCTPITAAELAVPH